MTKTDPKTGDIWNEDLLFDDLNDDFDEIDEALQETDDFFHFIDWSDDRDDYAYE